MTDVDVADPQHALNQLLKQAGIDPNDVPRYDGIFLDGYRTVNRPFLFIEGNVFATTWHDWDCSPDLRSAIWNAYLDLEFSGTHDQKEIR